MNTRGLLATILAVALSFAPQLGNTSSAAGTYSARLISPSVGQVLYPGQKIRVEWRSTLPNVDLGACEIEVWLSLDGGRTFTTWISPGWIREPNILIGLFRTCLQTQPSWTFASGVNRGIPKATLPSRHRLL